MRENPLPLLVLFLAVAAVPCLARAQQSEQAAAVTVVEYDDYTKLKRMKARLNHGPHRKNPLAAGRVRLVNRMDKATTPTRRPLPRTRGHRSNSTFTTLHYERPKAAKKWGTGPRHKNRGANTSAADDERG